MRTVILPMAQVRKLRCREAKSRAQNPSVHWDDDGGYDDVITR